MPITRRSVKDNRQDDFVYDMPRNKLLSVKLSTPVNVKDLLAASSVATTTSSTQDIIASIKELEQHIQELECEQVMKEALGNSTSDNVRSRNRD